MNKALVSAILTIVFLAGCAQLTHTKYSESMQKDFDAGKKAFKDKEYKESIGHYKKVLQEFQKYKNECNYQCLHSGVQAPYPYVIAGYSAYNISAAYSRLGNKELFLEYAIKSVENNPVYIEGYKRVIKELSRRNEEELANKYAGMLNFVETDLDSYISKAVNASSKYVNSGDMYSSHIASANVYEQARKEAASRGYSDISKYLLHAELAERWYADTTLNSASTNSYSNSDFSAIVNTLITNHPDSNNYSKHKKSSAGASRGGGVPSSCNPGSYIPYRGRDCRTNRSGVWVKTRNNSYACRNTPNPEHAFTCKIKSNNCVQCATR